MRTAARVLGSGGRGATGTGVRVRPQLGPCPRSTRAGRVTTLRGSPHSGSRCLLAAEGAVLWRLGGAGPWALRTGGPVRAVWGGER